MNKTKRNSLKSQSKSRKNKKSFRGSGATASKPKPKPMSELVSIQNTIDWLEKIRNDTKADQRLVVDRINELKIILEQKSKKQQSLLQKQFRTHK